MGFRLEAAFELAGIRLYVSVIDSRYLSVFLAGGRGATSRKSVPLVVTRQAAANPLSFILHDPGEHEGRQPR